MAIPDITFNFNPMRIGLFVMCLLFVVSFAFTSQAPGLPVSEPQPPTMEFRVNEYRNMVIAAWVLSVITFFLSSTFLVLLTTNLFIVQGFLVAALIATGISLIWMAIVRAVSKGIDRNLRQSPDVYGGSEQEKLYLKWRRLIVWPWLMATIPSGIILVLGGILLVYLMFFYVG